MSDDRKEARLEIVGEFTIFTAQEQKERLLAALEGGGDLEVDLAQVSDLDSAGLQLMIAAKREAAARNKTLRFTGHSPAVLDTLDLCDLAGHFGDPVVIPRA